jgi:hypothetical protein
VIGEILFDDVTARRFARMALACVTREYPNKIAHVMMSDADARPPRLLTPAFYGCFDWHSAVHGHWVLAKLLPRVPEARAALERNLTSENLAAEAEYLRARPGFERPYGLAWLLMLDMEWPVSPLPEIVVEHVSRWLPTLAYPDRSGQHANTAFAMRLMLDWARYTGHVKFTRLLKKSALAFYLADRDAPVRWEPSGEDFLSPSLSEAWLMQKVLEPDEFREWLAGFLPDVSSLQPVKCADPSDGKLAHADGLNLSRAWMLGALSDTAGHHKLAEAHAKAGLAAVTGQHYEGGHWLATFAVYLLTGLENPR